MPPGAARRFNGDLFADLKLIDQVTVARKFLKGASITTFVNPDFDPSFKAGGAAFDLAGDFLELDAGDRTACVEIHRGFFRGNGGATKVQEQYCQTSEDADRVEHAFELRIGFLFVPLLDAVGQPVGVFGKTDKASAGCRDTGRLFEELTGKGRAIVSEQVVIGGGIVACVFDAFGQTGRVGHFGHLLFGLVGGIGMAYLTCDGFPGLAGVKSTACAEVGWPEAIGVFGLTRLLDFDPSMADIPFTVFFGEEFRFRVCGDGDFDVLGTAGFSFSSA